jgi:drug/metabolite transporter (DMT)-like permease
VLLGLAGALSAAVAYGAGSVLQGVAARRTHTGAALDPRLLLRLARQAPYVAGLGLDLAGFALSVVALRTLPLFAVQAAVASSIGVTALLAAFVLHERPSRREWTALAAIGVGLVLLAAAAAPDEARALTGGPRVALLAALPVVVAGGYVAARRRHAVALGALAGIAYGGVGVAARTVRVPDPLWHGLSDPLVWALVAYGVLGTLLYATALQRGSVTSATAALFAVETVVPAAFGIAFLGDRARAGATPFAVAGFAVTVAACLALARYAAVAEGG